MGNRTYLSALNERVVCPAYRSDFSGDIQTIAETAWHLPLPWLAMFREEDLVEETITVGTHDSAENFIGPITSRANAIVNLKSAYAPMRDTLGAPPELERYFLLMADELETFQFRFITIDWLEMDEPDMHEQFVRAWHGVLRGFDDGESFLKRILAAFSRPRPHPWLQAINSFTEFDPSERLPQAAAYLDGIDLSHEQEKIHARLLPGNCHQRSVWMPRA